MQAITKGLIKSQQTSEIENFLAYLKLDKL